MKLLRLARSLAFTLLTMALALPALGDCTVDQQADGDCGTTLPPPKFPHGNRLSEPLPDDDPRVQQLIDFFHGTFGTTIPNLTKDQLAALPPRYLDLPTHGDDPQSHVFKSSLVCQECHDSDWQVSGQTLPNMTYWAQGRHSPSMGTSEDLAANWSVFGDWSASIKALAGRDPVFLTQVETARSLVPSAAAEIDNTCFRCHSPLAQRQASHDGVNGGKFSHYMLYATLPDSGYSNPFGNQPLAGHRFATYGALGRDGISCSSCHTLGPDSLPWNGTSFEDFYGGTGPNDLYQGQTMERLRKDPSDPAFNFPFTASMKTTQGRIVGPDSGLETRPMAQAGLSLETASIAGDIGDNYLGSGVVCGACHIVVLPQIPASYQPGGPVPQTSEHYKRPQSCDAETFTSDPFSDPCIGLAYEQTTYFEWLNSGYGGGVETCQGCHMPETSRDSPVAQLNPALATIDDGVDSLPSRPFNRHSLVGINLFVHEMYQQFKDVLGIESYKNPGSRLPPVHPTARLAGLPLLNAGAESGNTSDWAPGSVAPQLIMEARTGTSNQPLANGNYIPNSGNFYFATKPSARIPAEMCQRVSTSQYYSQISSGKAAIRFGGYFASAENTAYDARNPLVRAEPHDGSGQILIGDARQSAFPDSGEPTTWTRFENAEPLQLPPSTTHILFCARPFATPIFLDDLFLDLLLEGPQLGASQPNYKLADNLLNAEQSIVELATQYSKGNQGDPAVEVSIGTPTRTQADPNTTRVDITVINRAGHKFPTGVAFRRAFLQVEVLDTYGNVMWASGQPNRFGAICNGPCNGAGSNVLKVETSNSLADAQPHFQVLTRQDQVQIYETRGVDEQGHLTSRALSQFTSVKDNRLLPLGWRPSQGLHAGDLRQGLSRKTMAQLTGSHDSIAMAYQRKPGDTSSVFGLQNDADYCQTPGPCTTIGAEGQDTTRYEITLPTRLPSAPRWIRARLNYQSIPPAYLAARFADGQSGGQPKPATQRLMYMVSRLDTEVGLEATPSVDKSFELLDDWAMVLSEDLVEFPSLN